MRAVTEGGEDPIVHKGSVEHDIRAAAFVREAFVIGVKGNHHLHRITRLHRRIKVVDFVSEVFVLLVQSGFLAIDFKGGHILFEQATTAPVEVQFFDHLSGFIGHGEHSLEFGGSFLRHQIGCQYHISDFGLADLVVLTQLLFVFSLALSRLITGHVFIDLSCAVVYGETGKSEPTQGGN